MGRDAINAVLMYTNLKKNKKGKTGFSKIKMKYSSIESKASDKVLLSTILRIKLYGRELSLGKRLSVSFKVVNYVVVSHSWYHDASSGQREVSYGKQSGLCRRKCSSVLRVQSVEVQKRKC